MRSAADIAIFDLPFDIPSWTVGLVTLTGGGDPLINWLVAVFRDVAKRMLGS